MKPGQQRCEVTFFTALGGPRLILSGGRTFKLSQVLGRYRDGGRWWLNEPSCEVWVLQCRPALLEVARFEDTDPPSHQSGWWVLQLQD